ncbi:MAG: SDR family NAD(P)-dependent oxidoreductase [Methylobacter sp.]|nr:SDR family NAD(P)-dependent oxidoreductase [Methylobacter sp.]
MKLIGGVLFVSKDRGIIGESLCNEREGVSKANKLIRLLANEVYPYESGRPRLFNEDEHSRLYGKLRQAIAPECVDAVYLWSGDADSEINDSTGNVKTYTAIDLMKLELPMNDGEDDAALRNDNRYLHRLKRFTEAGDSAAITTQKTLNGEEVEAFYLKKDSNPLFFAMPRPQPKTGEVLVALDCINLTGVNLDNDKDWGKLAGYFGTGVICGLGDEVTDWRIGEAVIIAAEGMPASHVNCPARKVFSAASFNAFSHEEIAGLMTTIIPAYYALNHVACVAAGETVLIDADSGAIAFAVDAVGRWLNARPLLYSKNDARLLILETLDGESTIDTRKPDFDELLIIEGKTSKVCACIRGAKANQTVLADSPSASGIHEIVIGFGDVDENLPDSIDGGNLTYVDAWNLAFTLPEIFSGLLVETSNFLNHGRQMPSALQTLSPDQTLAYLTSNNNHSAAHTKVLSLKNKRSVPVSSPLVTQPLFDDRAAYMITGGLGDIGLETAWWMVQNGAKSLILVGLQGAFDEVTKAVVKALEESGVQVIAAATDISDVKQVEKLLERVIAECPPLKGVLHAAVHEDSAFENMTAVLYTG